MPPTRLSSATAPTGCSPCSSTYRGRWELAASGRAGTVLYDAAALTVMGLGCGIINPILLSYAASPRFPWEAMPCSWSSSPRTRSWDRRRGAARRGGCRHVRPSRSSSCAQSHSRMVRKVCADHLAWTYWECPCSAWLIAGAIGGCGGLFLINGGISPIKESVPWPVESAILASAVHFLVANSFVVIPPAVAVLGEGVDHAHAHIAFRS